MGTRQSLKRVGPLTVAEKNLVAQVVLDQPGELRPSQINGLARALRRSKEAVRSMIEEAQEAFRANASRYVEVHMKATEEALAHGSMDGKEIAMKGAQWAIERMSGEGARIIEPKVTDAGQGGPRVMIGIRVGGVDATKEPVIDVSATEDK